MLDLNELLARMVELDGSDLHITVGMPPVFRVNGKLIPTDNPRLTPRDTKEMVYSILRQDQRERLEREWEYDFAYGLPGVARFRVNAYFQRDSLGAAFRHIPADIKSFEELGLPTLMPEFCEKPRGFVLVTGPTGSGKSTTLASMVDFINSTQEVHVITIEDPIEYLHQHRKSVVNQREVGADTHSFANALKYILRQDPDVIMIGEMRDLETIAAALTAAETGHLVFATLHTQDAAQTIDRVIDVFPPYQQQQVRIQLAGTLQGIVSQQLLPTPDGNSRVVACEVLVPTPGIRNMIREGKTHQLMSAMQAGQQYGMVTMDQSLADLHRRGRVTFDHALQRAVDANVLRTLIGRTP
ncbi:MAG: type IV pilus twitching motility protein PilT [Actinomycetia bacterium]|nr:type IV pilus twitching motility protein PilT [Actinomycetes bacterium]